MERAKSNNPAIALAEKSPVVLEEHARWLDSTGTELLNSVERMVRGDLWPWDKPLEQQATYGAFCGGVSFAIRFLRDLNLIVQDRQEMTKILASAGEHNPDAMIDKIMREFNFSPE